MKYEIDDGNEKWVADAQEIQKALQILFGLRKGRLLEPDFLLELKFKLVKETDHEVPCIVTDPGIGGPGGELP